MMNLASNRDETQMAAEQRKKEAACCKESTSSRQDERIVPLRLQKFLARAGVASRRGSENLMTSGRVQVNGKVVTELGSKVDPRVDRVEVDGVLVEYGQGSTTLMLHKPKAYISTMSDPFGRKCVAELVPVKTYPGLFPIGRLDSDTTGLLLFSTDGDLGNHLMHPSNRVLKTYRVEAQGQLSDVDIDRLRTGIELEDGMTRPAEVKILNITQEVSLVEVGIREGKKRQVRRMFASLRHPVISLHRFRIAQLELGDLEEGTWRILTEEECMLLAETV